jgi:hypothetical protein
MKSTVLRICVFSYLVLLIIALGCAASSSPSDAKQAVDPEDPLAALAWMAGYWQGETKNTLMEECWLPPRGGIMVGMHRAVFGPNRSFFEFLRIEATDQGIVYLASPRGRAATPFFLKETGKQGVVFENLEHDFPQRIIYVLEEGGQLRSRIEGEESGKAKASDWVWQRRRLP